jgi:hypothetical protein
LRIGIIEKDAPELSPSQGLANSGRSGHHVSPYFGRFCSGGAAGECGTGGGEYHAHVLSMCSPNLRASGAMIGLLVL